MNLGAHSSIFRHSIFQQGASLGRWAMALAVALAMICGSTAALARGSVQLANTSPEESDGNWSLSFTVNYGGKPDLAHVPVVLSFRMTTLYERSYTDESGDKPVLRKVPIDAGSQRGQEINLPTDIGFADGSGKIFNTTKFKIKIRRDRDFEAGEYTLTVRLAAGGTLGSPIRLTLQGENPVVDRRAIIFHSDKKSKPKAKPEEKYPASEDPDPLAEDDDDDAAGDDEPVEKPPQEKPKNGGCGCRVTGPEPLAAPYWLILAALGGLAAARRRRRS